MGRRAHRGVMGMLLSAALLVGILTAGQPVQAFDHGTTDREITQDMLKDTPPADYKIDESLQGDAKDGGYDQYFLKDDIQKVSIDIEEDNLNYLLQKADEKPTVMTNSVTIGDKKIGYTGLKTKGSYTLQHTVTDNPGSDRFSFTVNFGKYIKKKNGYSKRQNFFGCNKISFNNFYFDKSMMREYIAMKLLTEMGLPTPQYGLARLYINDKYYGVYFMVEALDSSILEQYYGVDDKEISAYLTKPERTTLEYDTAMDQYRGKDGTFDLSPVLKQDAQGNYKVRDELQDQASLWEEDEETLQDVAEMLPTVLEWQRRLTQLSEGKDFEGKKIDVNSEEYVKLLDKVIDVDEALRYFAAHSWLVQLDNMFVEQHNLGLYVDRNGRSMMMPWDYDLSFGCYYPSTAEATANMHIDLMYKDGEVAFAGMPEWGSDGTSIDSVYKKKDVRLDYSQFPFFQVIYQNKSLMEKYHQYMKDCSKIAALGGTTTDAKTYKPGWFSECISGLSEKLIQAAGEPLADNVYYLNYAAQPEDVQIAMPNLKSIIALRALGVVLQVDGIDARVCGAGCNLEALGNAVQGMNSSAGILAAVDAETGIYSIAEYENSWSARSPSLRIREMESGEPVYQNIVKSRGTADEDLKVYTIMNGGDVKGQYQLSIPSACLVSEDDEESRVPDIYSYTDEGELKKLEVREEDGRYNVTADSIEYIAFVSDTDVRTFGFDTGSVSNWLLAGGAVLLLVAAAVGIVLVLQRKKKKAKE